MTKWKVTAMSLENWKERALKAEKQLAAAHEGWDRDDEAHQKQLAAVRLLIGEIDKSNEKTMSDVSYAKAEIVDRLRAAIGEVE